MISLFSFVCHLTHISQVRHLEAIMRIAESFCKMRLSEYCSAQDIDRAIAVTVESFISSQKVSAKKALSRAFAKYVVLFVSGNKSMLTPSLQVHTFQAQAAVQAPCRRRPCIRGAINILRSWLRFLLSKIPFVCIRREWRCFGATARASLVGP